MEEITAEYAVAEIAAPPPLEAVAKVTVACKTDLGLVRENNEDKFEYLCPEDAATLARRGQVFVVCDGMGGHAAGQIASEIAAKTFIETYLRHPAEDPNVAILAAVSGANRFVLDVGRAIPSRRGMGTTLSALILRQGSVLIAQVGDSRVYRMRGGELCALTQDHTYVNELIRAGLLSPDLAESHPQKHVLTRAIGADDHVEPDVLPYDLEVGDTYLLCSDGLLNHVDDEGIAQILAGNAPGDAAWNLVNAARMGGGSDNITVVIVRIDAVER